MKNSNWGILKNLVGSGTPPANEPAGNWQFISFSGGNMGINFKAPSIESAKALLGKYGAVFTQDGGKTYYLSFDYEVKAGRLSSPLAIRRKIEAAE